MPTSANSSMKCGAEAQQNNHVNATVSDITHAIYIAWTGEVACLLMSSARRERNKLHKPPYRKMHIHMINVLRSVKISAPVTVAQQR